MGAMQSAAIVLGMGRDEGAMAEVALSCRELDATVAFFTERLGFVVDAVFPADAPEEVVVVGYGLRARLCTGVDDATTVLRIRSANPAAFADGAAELVAPNGTRIQFVADGQKVEVPALSPTFALTRATDSAWGLGRAGMQYRDLVPDRQGGFVIASHIRIPGGGPVPDYVHFHRVHAQVIYCHRGWVRVVYEDPGEPFVLNAGDCVLQPPEIRHRVLESSPGLEVIEVGIPARHETLVDHTLGLPTRALRPERAFAGQRFVRHVAADAEWSPWRIDGFEAQDTGVGTASGGVADLAIVRRQADPDGELRPHPLAFQLGVVLEGSATLRSDAGVDGMREGDAFCIPPTMKTALVDVSPDFRLLEFSIAHKR